MWIVSPRSENRHKAPQGHGSVLPGLDRRLPARPEALQEYRRLETGIVDLCTAAGKKKQIARPVEMSLELKRLRIDRDATRARL